MNTVKLYLVNTYEANIWYEKGRGFSLYPHFQNTKEYKSEDDGGKEYYLPEGYEVGEDVTGKKHIYCGETCCEICNNNGTPAIFNPDKYDQSYVALVAVTNTKKGGIEGGDGSAETSPGRLE